MSDQRIDFLTAQLIASNLDATAQEMSATVTRTALSPLFNEAHDFTTGIFDFRGQREARLVAQAPGCTLHLYAIVGAVEAMLERFRVNLHEGDILLLNDPYAGGTHGPDWTLVAPVCYQGLPILLPAVRAHMGDNGGPVAGGYNPRAEEAWQEGLRIPPIKIVERRQVRKDVMNWLLANNRLPQWLEGDLAAMIGACHIAETRIGELFGRFGLEGVRAAIDQIIDYSERRTRQQIALWPDGTYVGETWTDHDFHGKEDIKLHVQATVSGDSLSLDFSGSDSQAHGFINSPITNTRSFVFAAIASLLPSDIPINDGLMRPVEILAPRGSVVNPVAPAPCGHATAIVGAEIVEAVMTALDGAVPELVGVNAHKLPLAYTHGRDPKSGSTYVNLNFHGYTGGAGAAYGVDGWGLYPPIMAGVILPSIEMTEVQYPCRFLQHEIQPDTAGAGRWRGACGVRTEIRYLDPESRTHVMVSGYRHRIKGFAGANEGSPSWVTLRAGTPAEVVVTDVAFDIPMGMDDVIRFERGGGGGWGLPHTREPALIRDDLENGYITSAGAFQDYRYVDDDL
ncbi:MAG: hyuB2 [Chloroflexi bacterium]|nr:hyuB2 [Chloroflexota bacterium]